MCLGHANSVNLKPLCDSIESLSHNFGLGKFDVRCGCVFLCTKLGRLCCQWIATTTHLRTGDTRPASCTPGHVLGVGDTKQTFLSARRYYVKRRIPSLCIQYTSGPREKAGTLLERLEGRALDSCEGIQDLETPDGVEKWS